MQIITFLKTVYQSSLLAKIAFKIQDAYCSSTIFSLNSGGTLDKSLSRSVIINAKPVKERKTFGKILPTWYEIGECLYGISAFHFGLLCFALLFGISCSLFADKAWLSACITMLSSLLSLLLLTYKESLVSLFAGTVVGKFFKMNADVTVKPMSPFLFSFLTLVCVFSGIFLPLKFAFLVPLGFVLFLMLVYIKPIFVLCMIMPALSLFGTSICITLSVIFILSHLLQRYLGNAKKTKADYIDIILSVYIVLCLVGSLFSFSVADSLRVSAMWVILFLTVFVTVRIVNDRKKLISVLSSLLFGTLIASAIGLYQYLSGQVNTTWTDTTLFENLSIRIYSTFANPNVFGEFLLLVIPFAAGLGLYFREWKYKLAAFGVLGVSLIALALTYSRGCYVGIAVTVVVFLWMYSKKILGILLVLGVPVGITMLPDNMLQRIMSMVNLSDTSTSYRLKIYEGSFGMLAKFWPSGVGIGEAAFNHTYPYFGYQGIVAPHSHSLFLQLLISFGIAGFLYFAFLMFVYHRNIISTAVKTPKEDRSRVLLMIFGSVMFGFLVQSIFDYTWYNYRVYFLFWLILALGFAFYKIVKREGEHCD